MKRIPSIEIVKGLIKMTMRFNIKVTTNEMTMTVVQFGQNVFAT